MRKHRLVICEERILSFSHLIFYRHSESRYNFFLKRQVVILWIIELAFIHIVTADDFFLISPITKANGYNGKRAQYLGQAENQHLLSAISPCTHFCFSFTNN
jgi:hypothetical protein